MKRHYYKEDIKNICLDKHITVDQIFEEVQKKHPSAWRSTIYRNVDEMVVEGSLKKLCWIWTKALYEAENEPHVHLIDELSWEIMDLPVSAVSFNLPEWFEFKDADIRIYGEFKKGV